LAKYKCEKRASNIALCYGVVRRRIIIFTALHAMQTRYSDENSVRPSVRLSVRHTRAL